MRKIQPSSQTAAAAPLRSLCGYLRRNFPDFLTEARFWIGDDDYFLYARFGAYLVRRIEQNRAPRGTINRGFTVLNRMARAAARHPSVRQMLLCGALESLIDAPKARARQKARIAAGTGVSRGAVRKIRS